MQDDLVKRASQFAIQAHARINARRKYTLDPYDTHLRDVAKIVASVTDDAEMIAAAWLHDIVEDTPITHEDIEREFGPVVADLVEQLTDVSKPSDGNRKIRKAIDCRHTETASPRAKTIKLADLIDNACDITRHDPRFAKVYLSEMASLLEVLGDGDPNLHDRARKILGTCEEQLARSIPNPEMEDFSPDELSLLSRQRGIRLFTQAFTARDIMEPLLSFDNETLPDRFAHEPSDKQPEVMGVREGGRITGYLIADDWEKPASPKRRRFAARQVLDVDAPLVDVIHVLTQFSFCFISIDAVVIGVIRRVDIEKPVVRMWLFGMIIVFEMFVTDYIRKRWPGEQWTAMISEGRLQKTQQLYEERLRRKTCCDLFDCLQFGDKLDIVSKENGFSKKYGYSSERAVQKVFKEFELLRNNLAHGQAISTQNWISIVRLTSRIYEILKQ